LLGSIRISKPFVTDINAQEMQWTIRVVGLMKMRKKGCKIEGGQRTLARRGKKEPISIVRGYLSRRERNFKPSVGSLVLVPINVYARKTDT
jgi:hypothetical protein